MSTPAAKRYHEFVASLDPAIAEIGPWSVDETDACFIVRDANGQALAYVYFEDGSHR